LQLQAVRSVAELRVVVNRYCHCLLLIEKVKDSIATFGVTASTATASTTTKTASACCCSYSISANGGNTSATTTCAVCICAS
jgi:hypothetical protein